MAKKNIVPEETAQAVAEAAPAAETVAPVTEVQEPKPAAKRGRKPAAAKAENAEKTEEKKPAAKRGRKPAAAKAENAENTEEKKPAAKRGRKPVAAKAEKAEKTEKKPAAKRGRKPAAAKAENVGTAEKKPAAKRGRKPAAAKAEKAAPEAKKTSRKKGTSYEEVVAAAKKKFLAANITRIKYPIAVNVELSGSVSGEFYIYVDADNQTIAVEPYRYDNYDVNFRADTDELLAVIKGKKNIYDALAGGLVKVSGITTKAILIIDAAF